MDQQLSDNFLEIDPKNRIQLQLLREIKSIFGHAGIPFWLRGGWALDFLLGDITRPHSDIDLVAWQSDFVQITGLLVENRFEFDPIFPIQINFSKEGQILSVLGVIPHGNGVCVDGIPSWIWHSDALSYPPQQLKGLACNLLSPKQLLEEKEGYLSGTGRPPRPKDLVRMKILRQFVDSGQ